MRAEGSAALANFLLVILLALGLAVVQALPDDSGVVVYANPVRSAVLTIVRVVLVALPFAALAFWRTRIHAQRAVAYEASGWRGVLEAGVVGFGLTLPFVLPGVIARQFNPGQWGQPQAFFLGLAYVGGYGLLGFIVGIVVGCMLWGSARVVLFIHRRVSS
jgi:hypothetical protein